MYECRFVRDDGETFYFDYEHGIIFDLDPLSEMDVDVSTSQGFNQVGETIENRSVGGVSREITGKIVSDFAYNKARLITVFAPFGSGRLYFNERYYCDCVVSKTPAISVNSQRVQFALVLYCSYPYWMGASETSVDFNQYTKVFEFPVCYDSHEFGIKSESDFVSILNRGTIDARFEVTFSSGVDSVTNYGLLNVVTMEKLMIQDTLSYRESVRVYWDGTRLKIEKTSADGTVSNIFAALDEDSDLFYLYPGENVLETIAESGSPTAAITYSETYAGVYDGM